ncbi:hypothetical protein S4A8_16287 [Salinisphaera sp. S4-8]
MQDFSEFALKYRKEFTRDIVKEPALTYFYNDLKVVFPRARYIMIQRHPLENIRSILNRLKIPGNLPEISFDDWPALIDTPVWRLALNSSWLGRESFNYVEALAQRWVIASEIYLAEPHSFTLIKYEDFLEGKVSRITQLAEAMDLPVRNGIGDSVDKQYQPKGTVVDSRVFFGEENLRVISRICEPVACRFGYEFP